MRAEPLVIYGDGEQTGDLVYIDDILEVVRRVIEKDLFAGGSTTSVPGSLQR